MEVPLVFMGSVILLSSFPVIHGEEKVVGNGDMHGDESSPRRIFFQKDFRIPLIGYDSVPGQYPVWDDHMQKLDTTFDSLMGSNRYVFNILRRLEIKFDRILDEVGFDGDNQMDDVQKVMIKLNTIHRDISRFAQNNGILRCPNEIGMSQINIINELITAVDYANEKLGNVAIDVDQVTANVKKSMKSLEKVVETTRAIDERTIRIHEAYSRQRWPRNILTDS